LTSEGEKEYVASGLAPGAWHSGSSKRVFDVVLSSLALILLSPLLLIVAIAIKLDSRGRTFYAQQRVGQKGRPFRIYKFRTMIPGADWLGPLITSGSDNRITRIGRSLRKCKLDEVPQLINVLKGDMSLVGPRPEVTRYVELFPTEYQKILSVRPGLTDLASIAFADEEKVLAAADDSEKEYLDRVLPEKIRLAKLYIQNSSLSLDLRIIVKTFLRVARGK
jgi:lipopolysaccharide/colanic/teichoic acid biosynthesis glycosyltransferase